MNRNTEIKIISKWLGLSVEEIQLATKNNDNELAKLFDEAKAKMVDAIDEAHFSLI